MSFLKKYYYCIFLLLFAMSCAPSPPLNVEEEKSKIIQTLQKVPDTDRRIAVFYPETFNKDSLRNVLSKNEEVLDIITKNSPKEINITINKVSSSAKIRNRYFKVVNITETFTVYKEGNLLHTGELKRYLYDNLIDFTENDTSFKVNKDTNLIAIYDNDSWEYFDFNIPLFFNAYGFYDTRKLVRRYYDEIFVVASEKWDAQSIKDFKDMYNENKDLPQYENLDFNGYCDCMIQHQEKLDYSKDIPDYYFESETYLNYIYSCRILTAYN